MDADRARDILVPNALETMDLAPFLEVKETLFAMARPPFLAVMNALAGCIGGDEIYLEVGTYLGGSLISTLLNNNVKAIGVDDFSQFSDTGSRAALEANLDAFRVHDRVLFYEVDYRQFFREQQDIPKVGLYYYDGPHDAENTTLGLELGFPHVVQDGIIVLDDTLYPEVCVGLNRFLGKHPQDVKIVFAVSPAKEFHNSWWNGTVFLQKLRP